MMFDRIKSWFKRKDSPIPEVPRDIAKARAAYQAALVSGKGVDEARAAFKAAVGKR
jgi:hypothetical protein